MRLAFRQTHLYRFVNMVGVSGFEPEASWTRTKRDTKLRHTPIYLAIIMNFLCLVKPSFPEKSYFHPAGHRLPRRDVHELSDSLPRKNAR